MCLYVVSNGTEHSHFCVYCYENKWLPTLRRKAASISKSSTTKTEEAFSSKRCSHAVNLPLLTAGACFHFQGCPWFIFCA